jgi:DNA-binding LacI/PurR family transcriptional regulator
MAIVGFDDIPAASWLSPRLSTVAQYPREMGMRLAEAVFERIHGEYSGTGRRIEVPCRLIDRESA